MITIDSTASLEAILGESATTQCRVACTYTDITQATAALAGPYMANVATNSTTAVTLLSAPSSGVARQLATLSCRNIDNVTHNVTIRSNVSSTYTQHVYATLLVGETLTYEHGRGWTVLDSTGTAKQPYSGTIVQVVYSEVTSSTTGTTTIPNDDTIPQNTEGDEYMTCAIAPKSTTNKLVIEVVAVAGNSAAVHVIMALFQDSTANALAATKQLVSAGSTITLPLTHVMTAGTTSSTTFKIRIGGSGAGTTTFNGQGGTRNFGGVCSSIIKITEIAT